MIRDLIRQKDLVEFNINAITKKINEKLYTKCGLKGISYDKLKVDVTITNDSSVLMALADIEQLEREKAILMDKLDILNNTLESFYKTNTERDIRIYLDRYYRGYSVIKIGIREGLSNRQVYNICKKVEKSLKK